MAAVIDRMNTRYRLAGSPDRRAHLARRLDRVVSDRLADALENLSGPDSAEVDGPVFCIRKLRLRLWLDAAKLDDAATARCMAEAILQAIYRQQADGGPADVMRFPSLAAQLAAYVTDTLEGVAGMRWYWDEFRIENELPTGTAIAAVLARHADLIGEVMALLLASRRIEQMVARLGHVDVLSLWQSWTGSTPDPGDILSERLLVRLRSAIPPELDHTSRAGRARLALGWLVSLTSGTLQLPADRAASAALQLSYLTVLLASPSNFRVELSAVTPDPAKLRMMLEKLPDDLGAARVWAAEMLANSRGLAALQSLARVVDVPETNAGETNANTQTSRLRSDYAGAVLLLPAIQQLGIADRLGPLGRQQLLVAASGRKFKSLAAIDPLLRALAGVPENALPSLFPDPDWPEPDELGVSFDMLEKDCESHSSGPELASLRACAEHFAVGLRGMSGSSLGYLARQFFRCSGTLHLGQEALVVRLKPPPLAILLSRGGRIGEQGSPGWFEGRQLIVELDDG